VYIGWQEKAKPISSVVCVIADSRTYLLCDVSCCNRRIVFVQFIHYCTAIKINVLLYWRSGAHTSLPVSIYSLLFQYVLVLSLTISHCSDFTVLFFFLAVLSPVSSGACPCLQSHTELGAVTGSFSASGIRLTISGCNSTMAVLETWHYSWFNNSRILLKQFVFCAWKQSQNWTSSAQALREWVWVFMVNTGHWHRLC
jgi:hypothetical protein